MGSSDASEPQPQPAQPELELEAADDAGFTLWIEPPAAAKSDRVRLEHVSAGDTVLSLRQLIAEYPALACYTCYHLEAASPADPDAWYAAASLPPSHSARHHKLTASVCVYLSLSQGRAE